ncbi:hypothetical protein KSP40_PGU008417 [Platanthera guangdongensis]|uniref:Uncharacterized protein n=1 Tax=Platanthera guangdongensis TaxID=2320717 RepID=A0ABR2LI10_9ASPA
MAADKGKKSKVAEQGAGDDAADHIDGELVLSIEKLQELQDDLDKFDQPSVQFAVFSSDEKC